MSVWLSAVEWVVIVRVSGERTWEEEPESPLIFSNVVSRTWRPHAKPCATCSHRHRPPSTVHRPPPHLTSHGVSSHPQLVSIALARPAHAHAHALVHALTTAHRLTSPVPAPAPARDKYAPCPWIAVRASSNPSRAPRMPTTSTRSPPRPPRPAPLQTTANIFQMRTGNGESRCSS